MADATNVNLAFFGKPAVGKTALIARYLQNEFITDYEPTMVEAYTKESRVEGTTYVLSIADTGADPMLEEERGRNRAKANVFILVYSIAEKETLTQLSSIYADIQKAKPDAKIVVVGNQTDNEAARAVSTQEGQAAADSMNAAFFEASAKDGTNVEAIFKEAVLSFATGKRQQKQAVAEPPPPPPPTEATPPPPPPPAAPQKVEGWLTKTPRGLFGSQQHRYFRLEGKSLSYFKTPEDKEPIRVLNLCNASFIVTADSKTFKLDGPQLDPVKPGAVTLTTNNQDEFNKWRVAIDVAIRA